MDIHELSNSLFGYNKYQVNELVTQRNQQIEHLQEEVNQLKEDVDVLTKQLAKYIEMEQALKEGIVDARMTGSKIVEESTQEAEKIVQRTNEQVSQYREEFAHHSHSLIHSGEHVRELMKTMKTELLSVLKNYESQLQETDFDALYPENQLEQFASQVKEYETISINQQSQRKEKSSEVSNMTEDEKKELQKLIQEVIANEKQQQTQSDSETKLVQFAKL